MIKAKMKPYELLDYLKNHPVVKPLLEGGNLLSTWHTIT